MRANFFNGAPDSDDDWFRMPTDIGTGDFIIDTTGAAAIVAGYTTNPASRSASFARGMRFPLLSTINNRIYYDASYVRDHRGTDSTSFTGGSKNGMNPLNWITTISPVLSKNDILDVMMHVRRAGTTANDTLWFFGAVSVQGTNGDRYFDFELYQTDITFNRSTGKFENVGPDAGHTAWQFDAAGNPTRLGDIIFTAEYSNSGLTFIEARIWVARTALTTVNPAAFDFSGTFDGDGNNAVFGYAGIVPNDAGVFYQGLQNAAATWAGPFGTITASGTIATEFTPIQLMEFSVNLTKLGLDPMNFSSGSICNLAFRKVLVKSRTSTSFTSNMTDFVLPFTFSAQAYVDIGVNFPLICPTQEVANLWVKDPLLTSNYYWTTTNGTIVGSTSGTLIQVSGPGTYVVHQEMLTGCGVSATDTLTIIYNSEGCYALPVRIHGFTATPTAGGILLSGAVNGMQHLKELILERAADNEVFRPLTALLPQSNGVEFFRFSFTDVQAPQELLLYRLRMVGVNDMVQYSPVVQVRIARPAALRFTIAPNPLQKGRAQLQVHAAEPGVALLRILHSNGQLLYQQTLQLRKGEQQFWLADAASWPRGTAAVQLRMGDVTVTQQILIGATQY